MREIKFRAWDRVNELMSKVTSLTYNNMNQQLTILNKKGHFSCLFYDVVLMQYTGLEDKNKNEIYEGDLLKVELDWGYGLAEIIIEVYFKDGCFRAKALNSHEDTLLIELPPCEVIGNVYENPELLKEDK